ncbi:DUF6924 domain-containing protein [Streptomyces sp. NPDC058052]|uniref:DUF6924 domain-containing protein n=1 Tax=Streptomyces sp. NPDC058052 TaxID=3346316 RepID=UPI0036EA46C9
MTNPESPQRVLPESDGRDAFDALVIRTDFSDDGQWQAVVRELHLPWGDDGEFPASVRVVDDPAWSGATADEVFAAVEEDEDLPVVFLADRRTMESPVRALLALTTSWEDRSGLDPVYYQDLIDRPNPREFRAVPAAVHPVHTCVSLGNMGFAEFAATAAESPGQVLPG